MDIRILIADKDENLAANAMELLEAEGYAVDIVSDGISVIKLLRRNEYNLVIIEDDLPELDGLSVCNQIRKMADVPFVITSAKGDEISKLEGYTVGADDYLIKPVSLKELLAKVKVILRRTSPKGEQTVRKLIFGGLCIDTLSHVVNLEDREVFLTPKEYQLLLLFASNPDKVLSREFLINELWGDDYYGTDRTVDTHIKTLREALKPKGFYITTVRGFGYKFNENCK